MTSYQQALSFFEAESKLFNKSDYLETEIVELTNVSQRILAEDLFAQENHPSFDNSAMDGFAVSSHFVNTQIEHHGYAELIVKNRIAAGDDVDRIPIGELNSENCLETMTGAYFFSNIYDAVVRVEDVVLKEDLPSKIKITKKLKPYENVRRAGEDFEVGQGLLRKFDKVTTTDLLALAALGLSQIRVFKKPQVGILSTGNELSSCDVRSLKPGRIRNSTALFLSSWFQENNCHVRDYGICQDRAEDFVEKINKAFDDQCDIFISTGAVSMGRYDFVTSALERIGAQIHFHKCAIRPGKPLLFASIEYKNKRKYIFGLPGNPISTAVGARFFVKPFMDSLFFQAPTRSCRKAKLLQEVKKPEGLRCFFKAQTYFEKNELWVSALRGQSSFMVRPIQDFNSWVVLPEEGHLINKNSIVEVYDL